MRTASAYRGWLAASLGGTVAVAWLLLWWLERTPWAALFHAHGGGHAHGAHALPWPATGAAFVAGWTLMTVAMMLPSTFPLMEIFRRAVRRRPHPGRLLAALAAGYLAAWGALGVVVFSAGQLVAAVPLPLPGWVASAGLFALAGAFQFSGLKYRCLDRCRAPLGFVAARWHGRRGAGRAFRIGVDHGLYCAGCCWALMLLMFAVATANLLWMLLLGCVMAVEKNAPWGRRIGRPLGYVLLAASVAIVIGAAGGA